MFKPTIALFRQTVTVPNPGERWDPEDTLGPRVEVSFPQLDSLEPGRVLGATLKIFPTNKLGIYDVIMIAEIIEEEDFQQALLTIMEMTQDGMEETNPE